MNVMNIINIIKKILKWLILYLLIGMVCFIFIYFSRYDELLINTLLPNIIHNCKVNMKND
jgi:hypothetical protein